MSRQFKNGWLQGYLSYTEQLEAPELFHLWTGVGILAATLGRQVRVTRGNFFWIYPNHYVVLLAGSAECRKSVASGTGLALFRKAKLPGTAISSEKITNAALWKALGDLSLTQQRAEMLIFADELRSFLSAEEANKGVITTLMRLYTCPDLLENRTKTAGIDTLLNCCVNMLVATTPADFTDIVPGVATGSGFVPRLHIVYQEIPRPRRADLTKDEEKEGRLIEDLQHIRKTLQGDFAFTPDAWKWWKNWYENELCFPEDEQLNGFYGRKHDYVLKLGMVLSASEKDELILTKGNLTQALDYLDQIESFMRKAYNLVDIEPTLKYAERVWRQIRRAKSIKRRDLMHANWNKITAMQLSEVCKYLEENDLIDVVVDGKGTSYRMRKGKQKFIVRDEEE